jgi:acid phosphatase
LNRREKESRKLKNLLALISILAGVVLAPINLNAQQTTPAQKPAAAHSSPRFSSTAPGESIPNLDTLKDRLKQYHDCKRGCYASDLDMQAGRAIAYLHQRAAHRRPDEKLALVFDIDETTLSNYEEMLKTGFAYNGDVFNAWVQQASAPAIPGTLRIFKEAQRLGVAVFFLTGRPEKQRSATEQNLHSQGFDNWQQLIMRAPGQGSSSALEYKSAARAGIVDQGFRLVLNVGDQWSDLHGNPEAEFSVKYPDPYYFIK